MSTRMRILAEISGEMTRSTIKHGDQTHLPDGTGGTQAAALAAAAKADTDAAAAAGTVTWAHILDEEVREALAEAGDVELRAELVQVASTAAKWIEAVDKRAGHHRDEPALTRLGHDHNLDIERWSSRRRHGHLAIDEGGVVHFVVDFTEPELGTLAPEVEPATPVDIDAVADAPVDRQSFADAADVTLKHPLIVGVMTELRDNLGVGDTGLPAYGIAKVAHYAAQVARAQALGVDPEALRS